MKRIKIDKNDVSRVLLSEILPYEIPMLFSNEGFYKIVASNKINYFINKVKFEKYNYEKKEGKYSLPFDFEITKKITGETRTLSIIHPLNQLMFIEFYKKYDSIILHQCSKSPFSLRKPEKIAKFYYSPKLVFDEDELKGAEVETEPDILTKESKILKSYFIYKPIDLIYKFYERNEFLRLEQKYNYLHLYDINKCFYNIYTHSISWAVKDKESAKKNASKLSFENHFDKIMQLSNYNETNGIVVGPEISRIFAEIILQQVDINVLKLLDNKDIKFGVDYEIKRYVDDYFVFSNNKEILTVIHKTVKDELQKYKLYLNDAKTTLKEIPFITNIAVAKNELNHILNDFINNLITIEKKEIEDGKTENVLIINKVSNIFGNYGVYSTFIKDFQSIVKRNELTYDILSKDVIRKIKTFVIKLFKFKEFSDPDNSIEKLLLLILEITFYTYSLNITSTSTFKVSQIIVLITKYLSNKELSLKNNIFSKIKKESDFVIGIFNSKSLNQNTNVEILNLLIAIKNLGDDYLLSNKKIKEVFKIKVKDDYKNLNYFQIITLIYYIGNNNIYQDIKRDVVKAILYKFNNEKDHFIKTELFMLFFDIINCPYVDEDSKIKIMKSTNYIIDINEKKEIEKISENEIWFMNWSSDINLERVLKRKEWLSPY